MQTETGLIIGAVVIAGGIALLLSKKSSQKFEIGDAVYMNRHSGQTSSLCYILDVRSGIITGHEYQTVWGWHVSDTYSTLTRDPIYPVG